MLTEYIQAAMRHAKYEILEDGTFFATIPDFPGLWAHDAHNLEGCREELLSTLEDWMLVSFRHGDALPVVDGIDLNISTEPLADVAD